MKGSEARAASGVAADDGRSVGLCRHNGQPARRRVPLAAWGLAAVLIFGPLTVGVCSATTAAPSEAAKSVAFLNVQFLNDHEDLEPTTSAERARLALIASLFKAKLEASSRYTFVSIPADAAPCRPGILDLRAIGSTARILKLAGKPAFVVLNATPPHSRVVEAPRVAAPAGRSDLQ